MMFQQRTFKKNDDRITLFLINYPDKNNSPKIMSRMQCWEFSNFVAIFSDFHTPFETF